MVRLNFSVWVDCTVQELWDVLWQDESYREWTSVFSSESHAVSDWKEGSEIRFIGSDGCGMYSVIERKNEPSYMLFEHLGEIKDGVNQPESAYRGSNESYELSADVVGTMLKVVLNTKDDYAQYFADTFPLALQKLKDIAEEKYEHEFISIRVDLNATVARAWEVFTHPHFIMEWNRASDTWHTPSAINDLRVGGKFDYRMESKRGKAGFNFTGTYTAVERHKLISYEIADGRKVIVRFIENPDTKTVSVIDSFHPESEHPKNLQRGGWQNILENYSLQVTL